MLSTVWEWSYPLKFENRVWSLWTESWPFRKPAGLLASYRTTRHRLESIGFSQLASLVTTASRHPISLPPNQLHPRVSLLASTSSKPARPDERYVFHTDSTDLLPSPTLAHHSCDHPLFVRSFTLNDLHRHALHRRYRTSPGRRPRIFSNSSSLLSLQPVVCFSPQPEHIVAGWHHRLHRPSQSHQPNGGKHIIRSRRWLS